MAKWTYDEYLEMFDLDADDDSPDKWADCSTRCRSKSEGERPRDITNEPHLEIQQKDT